MTGDDCECVTAFAIIIDSTSVAQLYDYPGSGTLAKVWDDNHGSWPGNPDLNTSYDVTVATLSNLVFAGSGTNISGTILGSTMGNSTTKNITFTDAVSTLSFTQAT